MKLSVLFIMMQLLLLVAIQANDLSLDQQEMSVSLQDLQRELAKPWSSNPCINNCLEEMGSLVEQPGECQQFEQQFDCTLYCMFVGPSPSSSLPIKP
ncbi:uncharacterized protein LOC108106347 [Drosophila eugracilis]|uniref:uncharacterized protein LOC108106347 n=1 Tax=Drosophila eugracilis TaxID=29029 RepID=UPI0007E77C4D|nr:uncharacterized protein LOC108106347 [Drosophila eugracilis]